MSFRERRPARVANIPTAVGDWHVIDDEGDFVASFKTNEAAEQYLAEHTEPCVLCRRPAGPGYHIGGPNNEVICDNCWDERMR